MNLGAWQSHLQAWPQLGWGTFSIKIWEGIGKLPHIGYTNSGGGSGTMESHCPGKTQISGGKKWWKKCMWNCETGQL